MWSWAVSSKLSLLQAATLCKSACWLLLLWCLLLGAEWLVFEGISVDESGKQHYLDATVAYKRAVLNCIHYLAKFGYTKEQVGCTGMCITMRHSSWQHQQAAISHAS